MEEKTHPHRIRDAIEVLVDRCRPLSRVLGLGWSWDPVGLVRHGRRGPDHNNLNLNTTIHTM